MNFIATPLWLFRSLCILLCLGAYACDEGPESLGKPRQSDWRVGMKDVEFAYLLIPTGKTETTIRFQTAIQKATITRIITSELAKLPQFLIDKPDQKVVLTNVEVYWEQRNLRVMVEATNYSRFCTQDGKTCTRWVSVSGFGSFAFFVLLDNFAITLREVRSLRAIGLNYAWLNQLLDEKIAKANKQLDALINAKLASLKNANFREALLKRLAPVLTAEDISADLAIDDHKVVLTFVVTIDWHKTLNRLGQYLGKTAKVQELMREIKDRLNQGGSVIDVLHERGIDFRAIEADLNSSLP